MKERFKAYLEEQFRQIAPTKSAMEYRKGMLVKMMDRAQELRIKGMNDDELIYNAVIAEFGNISDKLRDYENRTVKKEVGRRISALGAIVSVVWLFILVVSYLIVGCVAHIWHPTWLIIVGGIMIGVIALMGYLAFRLAKKKQWLPLRGLLVGIEILVSIVLFLFLQLVGNINGSWMTFLAMVALIVCVDTVLAFVSANKFKWVELPVAVEILCVMLYVIIGISLSYTGIAIWHPGWLLCLGGVAVGLVEGIIVLSKRTAEKKKEKIADNTDVDESYWTEWDD